MIEALQSAMLKAAEELNFEKAAELRDRMIQLKKNAGGWIAVMQWGQFSLHQMVGPFPKV